MSNILFNTLAPAALSALLSLKSAKPRINLPLSAFKASVFPELVEALTRIYLAAGVESDTPLVTVTFKDGLANRVFEPSIAKNADGLIVLQLPTVSIPLTQIVAGDLAPAIEKIENEYCLTLEGLPNRVLLDTEVSDGSELGEIVLNCRIDIEAVKDVKFFNKFLVNLEKKGELASIFMLAGGNFPKKIAGILEDGTTYPLCWVPDDVEASTFWVTEYRAYSNTYEGRTTQEFAVKLRGFPQDEYRANRSIADVLKCQPVVSPEQPLVVIVTGSTTKKNANGAYAILQTHITVSSVDSTELFELGDF